jgi:hypothetical protein
LLVFTACESLLREGYCHFNSNNKCGSSCTLISPAQAAVREHLAYFARTLGLIHRLAAKETKYLQHCADCRNCGVLHTNLKRFLQDLHFIGNLDKELLLLFPGMFSIGLVNITAGIITRLEAETY